MRLSELSPSSLAKMVGSGSRDATTLAIVPDGRLPKRARQAGLIQKRKLADSILLLGRPGGHRAPPVDAQVRVEARAAEHDHVAHEGEERDGVAEDDE